MRLNNQQHSFDAIHYIREPFSSENDPSIFVHFPSAVDAIPMLTHNDTAASNDELRIIDHTIAGGVADQIRGGTGIPPVNNYDPGFKWNHNETIVSDREDDVTLTVLVISNNEADQIRGGDGTFQVGSEPGYKWNHNETMVGDEEDRPAFIETLITDEQADQIRAGTSEDVVVQPGYRWNHNETIVRDPNEEDIRLTDLPVTDDQSDEVSGGPLTFPSKGGGMWIAQ